MLIMDRDSCQVLIASYIKKCIQSVIQRLALEFCFDDYKGWKADDWVYRIYIQLLCDA